MPYGIGMARRYDATMYTVSVVSSELTYPFVLTSQTHSIFGTPPKRRWRRCSTCKVPEEIKHIGLIKEGLRLCLKNAFGFRRQTRHRPDRTWYAWLRRNQYLWSVPWQKRLLTLRLVLCSLLGHTYPRNPRRKGVQRILCAATALQPPSASMLAYALALAADEHAHLILLHVLSADRPSQDREAEKDLAMNPGLQSLPPRTSPSPRR